VTQFEKKSSRGKRPKKVLVFQFGARTRLIEA